MAYSFIASVIAGSTDSINITTGAINTTGANLIVISSSWYSGATEPILSDSKSNTWTSIVSIGNTDSTDRLYYCVSPTIDSSHTFTLTSPGAGSFPSIGVVAFSGASGSPLDQFNSNFSGQSGSITPTQNNEVVVSGMSSIDSATATVDSGFTGIAVPNVTAQHIGNGIAYLIQTTATSENVTWSVGDGKVTIASFISGSGSAGFISLGPTIQYRRRR